MKYALLIPVLLAAACSVSQANPCLGDAVASSASLGAAGCDVNGVTFSHFDWSGATMENTNDIVAGEIQITPTAGLNRPTLDFSATWGAFSAIGPSDTATLLFRAESTAPIYLTSSGSACLAGGITASGTNPVTKRRCLKVK